MSNKEYEKRLLEARKKYSSGPLLKKKSCNGRTIKIETLDQETINKINRRVSATAKQHVIEKHNTLTSKTSQKVFKKVR